MTAQTWLRGLGAASLIASAGSAYAQVPPEIAAGLSKIGQIVDPASTAKLYRPLMPANDYNTYWPVGASAPASTMPLYPGVTIARDVSFGSNPKDLLDVFTSDRGGDNRTVLIYVPGGGGNKIEQQAREANAFYDNIGRWAVKNGMVGVTVQRHPGQEWDDGGRDLSVAVDWLKANVAKYKGNPDRMFIWAHSAGNGPLGLYIGHPERWKNGVGVKGAIFMSGNPVQGLGARGGARGPIVTPGIVLQGEGATPAPAGSACGITAGGNAATAGAIAGPSGLTPVLPGARGGGPGRGGALDEATLAARSNLPGLKATKVAIMLARAELDPGVSGAMLPADVNLHDELCETEGAKAKDGAGRCPTMLYARGESHMSEVFSIDTADKTVSGPILEWIKKVK